MAAKYKKIEKIGKGAHGVVWKCCLTSDFPKIESAEEDGKAFDQTSRLQLFAVKKIRVEHKSEGLSMTAIREIMHMQELDHPNVLKMYDIYMQYDNIHLVLEFMKTDMERIIHTPGLILAPGDRKMFLKMLLEGVKYCHERWLLHRDIKPANLLVSSTGCLKLADFGLAKLFASPSRELSKQACTIWYRAPELLFGSTSYSSSADMWSVGCIFGEMLGKSAIFPGTGDLDQLAQIFSKLGTPSEETWPEMVSLPNYVPFEKVEKVPLKTLFPAGSQDELDLFLKICCYNPSDRLSAAEALQHVFFQRGPDLTPADELPGICY